MLSGANLSNGRTINDDDKLPAERSAIAHILETKVVSACDILEPKTASFGGFAWPQLNLP
jgi:hypothetical protein